MAVVLYKSKNDEKHVNVQILMDLMYVAGGFVALCSVFMSWSDVQAATPESWQ